MIGESPADHFARAEVDDDGQVEPPGSGRDEGDIARKNLVDMRGKRLVEQEILGWTIGSTIAGFRHVMLWSNGAQSALGHDSTHTGRCASATLVSEFRADAAVAIAPPMSVKNTRDVLAHLPIRELGIGERCSVVKAATRHIENGANPASATPRGSGNTKDH